MTTRSVSNLCFLLVTLLSNSVVADSPDAIRIDWSNVAHHSHHIRVSVQDGVISFRTEGTDPYFHFAIPALPNSNRSWIMEFSYFCPEGVNGLQWRSGRKVHHPSATPLPPMPKAEGWTRYTLNLNETVPEFIDDASESDERIPVRIDLGNKAGVQLQVRDVVVRTISDQEVEHQNQLVARSQSKQRLATRIRDYLSRDWPAAVTSATFDGTHLRLTGSLQPQSYPEPLFIIARHPESVAADPPSTGELDLRWPAVVDHAESSFEVSIPTAKNSPWMKSGTRFQLVRASNITTAKQRPTDSGPELLSPAVYVQPSCASEIPPPKKLVAAKGLTCVTSKFSSQQLRELGLGHASINIVLSGLVSEQSRPGWTTEVVEGQTWWTNESRLQQLDLNVRTATDAGLVVAGILLIPTPIRHPAPLAHPESTGDGTYVMPNLTDARAVARYVATLNTLAKRYNGITNNHGRIDHWIVHNEVDYGWQWTNMGEQPIEVYMDHYARSMRLVDAVTRRFNPHARTFISLTHRWNATDNQHWRTYAPKRMLEWLIQAGKLEGDFPWGVAYHPYPQSLWKADVWNDTQVSDSFDTPLITIKNLQVLDRFMQQKSSRTSDGHVRPVICSEQGFHADINDPRQLEIQAAALLYTWNRLRECPSIIAFDYHRPSDHPREGGLRLGLRGLPDQGNPQGIEKPAWKVYATIGTDREAEMLRRYQGIWTNDDDQ